MINPDDEFVPPYSWEDWSWEVQEDSKEFIQFDEPPKSDLSWVFLVLILVFLGFLFSTKK